MTLFYSFLRCRLFAWCVGRGTAVNLSGEQGNMAVNSRAASSERGMRGNVPSQGAKAAQSSLSITCKALFPCPYWTWEHLVLVAINEII